MDVRRAFVHALAALLLVASPRAAPEHLLVTVAARPAAADYRDFRRPPSYAGGARVAIVLDALAREHGVRRTRGWPIPSLDVYCEVFSAPDGTRLEPLLARLRADPRVDSAQRLLSHATRASVYDDPLHRAQQRASAWPLAALHRVARGDGATIAVVDAGIDRAHRDFAGHVAVRADFTDGRAAGAHGTAVAGLIVAQPGNGVGLVGVAPGARVLDLQACWAQSPQALESRCDSLSVARALDAAIGARARVINLSLSGPDDPLVGRLIAQAVARGASVVAAAGPAPATFPATRADVIAVSGRSRDAVVQAPAYALWTTFPGGAYDVVSGDSFAAAQVAGLVALVRAHRPDWSPREVRAALLAQPRLEPLALLLAPVEKVVGR